MLNGQKKGTWVAIGVVLWGIPTGLMIALILAFVRPDSFMELQSFQQRIFIRSLMMFVPIFSALGIGLGLVMYQIIKKNLP